MTSRYNFKSADPIPEPGDEPVNPEYDQPNPGDGWDHPLDPNPRNTPGTYPPFKDTKQSIFNKSNLLWLAIAIIVVAVLYNNKQTT
jgi:hypothetical protein